MFFINFCSQDFTIKIHSLPVITENVNNILQLNRCKFYILFITTATNSDQPRTIVIKPTWLDIFCAVQYQ